jgi:hypothetical protein
MRIVTGSVSSGGTQGFTTAFASQTPTGSVSITACQVVQVQQHLLRHKYQAIAHGTGRNARRSLLCTKFAFAGQSLYSNPQTL